MKRLVGLLLMAASFAFAADQVPFVAVFTSSVPGGEPPKCAEGQFGVATVGTGHATHLGLFTSWEKTCLTPPATFSAGIFEFTGANGDKIKGLSAGFIKVIDGTPTIQGTFVIDGGSGRFENASGIGTAKGTVNPDQSVTDFVLTGTITRPNH